MARPGVPNAPTVTHPLLLINPLHALLTVLQSSGGGAVPLGRAAQVAVFATGLASGAGPAVEPWQATVVAQAALAALCVSAAVLLLRGRRPLTPPWGTADRTVSGKS